MDLLFVYGTLRRDVRNSVFHRIAREVRFVGRGRVQGSLFHLGDYPGLVLSRDPNAWVYGEVYALKNPSHTLTRLDAYEGCGPIDPKPREYERITMDVLLESGAMEKAWVYVYKGSTDSLREIQSGDYSQEDR
jgi:gamma-glutamylcyclotransferase (GGCT)/AIG2-like uncharacterized protein YtfP